MKVNIKTMSNLILSNKTINFTLNLKGFSTRKQSNLCAHEGFLSFLGLDVIL